MISFGRGPSAGSGPGKCPSTRGRRMTTPVENDPASESIRIASFSHVVSDRTGQSTRQYPSRADPRSTIGPL